MSTLYGRDGVNGIVPDGTEPEVTPANAVDDLPSVDRYDMTQTALDAYSEVWVPSSKEQRHHEQAMLAAIDAAEPFLRRRWEAEQKQLLHADAADLAQAGLTPEEHYREAKRLLSEASFVRSPRDPRPVTRDGAELSPEAHAALLRRAWVHALLAKAGA